MTTLETRPLQPGHAPDPLRVLFLNPFSQQLCGPDESLLNLLPELVARGVEAYVALPAPGPFVERYRAAGATVHFLPLTALNRSMGPLRTATYPLALLRGAAAVFRLARRLKVDLVHSNMEVMLDGALAARALRIPHVLHYRGNTIDRPKAVFDVLTWVWTRLSARVLCISESTAAVFTKRGYTAEVEVVYNPVDLAAFSNAVRSNDVRASLGAGEGDFLVGTVGRIHPRKDLETFLRAGARVAARDPRLKLVIVGAAEAPSELEYLPRVQALARELGIEDRVCFAGLRRDVPAVMKALDVFVLSSRHEGFGRVVAEAMATGTPVVASREGALPELLMDGAAGCLATPGDAAGFADCLQRMTEAPQPFIARSLESTARFDRGSIAARVLGIYRELVAPDEEG